MGSAHKTSFLVTKYHLWKTLANKSKGKIQSRNILTFISHTTNVASYFIHPLSCQLSSQVSQHVGLAANWRRVQGLGQGQGGPRRQGGDYWHHDLRVIIMSAVLPRSLCNSIRRFDASTAHTIRVLQIPNLAIDTQPGGSWSCDRAAIPGELKWKVFCTGTCEPSCSCPVDGSFVGTFILQTQR